MTLGKEIKSFSDFKDNYIEIYKYLLIQKRSNLKMPDDIEFDEKFVLKDIYNMNAKNKVHLLENIENYNNREVINVQSLLDENKLTIEHIMPRTLTKKWREEIGDSYQIVHEKYLHNIGNLTLTAYNSELSNKSFSEKKSIDGGFNQSKLKLNQSVTCYEIWNEISIIERANIM